MNDLLLLAALADGPKHGYRLKKEAGFVVGTGEIHNNVVYPLLRRFTAEKLIRSRVVPGKRGQTRTEYSLTAKGHEFLIQRLGETGEMQSGEDFLIRLGLFALLDSNTRLRILEERSKSIGEREARLEGIAKALPLNRYGMEVMNYLVAKTKLERELIERVAAKERKRR
jgi:DNA-binding PadR family transcriptional regulator